eukprot:GHVS01056403.1.p1 GENE.GHVS01056403.1~~GHVS01056403.1.p1  ORF type:complete len:176 (+),score=22.48 GHVS01056403.1:94-621(+)
MQLVTYSLIFLICCIWRVECGGGPAVVVVVGGDVETRPQSPLVGDGGCARTEDKQIIFQNHKQPTVSSSSLQSSSSAPSNAFFSTLFSCGRSRFGAVDATQKCVQTTLKSSHGLDISDSCSLCYAHSVNCGTAHCTFQCMLNGCSERCVQCGESNCDDELKACAHLAVLPEPCST